MPQTASQHLKRLQTNFELDDVEIDHFMQYLAKNGKNGYLMTYAELEEEIENLFNGGNKYNVTRTNINSEGR